MATTVTGLALLLFAAGGAQTQKPRGALAEAWTAWHDLDYERAAELLDGLEPQTLKGSEAARHFELLGLLRSTYGRHAEAVEAFERLLTLEPTYALPPGTAPKISDALAEARRAFAASHATRPQQPDSARRAGPADPKDRNPLSHPPTRALDGQSPWYKKGWLWAVVGAVVASGTIAAVILARDPYPERDFGPYTIR